MAWRWPRGLVPGPQKPPGKGTGDKAAPFRRAVRKEPSEGWTAVGGVQRGPSQPFPKGARTPEHLVKPLGGEAPYCLWPLGTGPRGPLGHWPLPVGAEVRAAPDPALGPVLPFASRARRVQALECPFSLWTPLWISVGFNPLLNGPVTVAIQGTELGKEQRETEARLGFIRENSPFVPRGLAGWPSNRPLQTWPRS